MPHYAGHVDKAAVPLVSIGMPIFNSDRTARQAIDSVLAQSVTDFELIISDNASTDLTAAICNEYAQKDRRIRYLRQNTNIGGLANCQVVRELATGTYFAWAAADDVRTPDWLEENIAALERDPSAVASTSPHVFEGQNVSGDRRITFALVGTVEERVETFFENCWSSHGIFYSLIRRDVLQRGPALRHFLAADWVLDLFLASQGNVLRTERALAVFGVNGESRQQDVYRAFRTKPIERVAPYLEVSRYALRVASGWPIRARLRLLGVLVALNLRPTLGPVIARLDAVTHGYLKAWYKRMRRI